MAVPTNQFDMNNKCDLFRQFYLQTLGNTKEHLKLRLQFFWNFGRSLADGFGLERNIHKSLAINPKSRI